MSPLEWGDESAIISYRALKIPLIDLKKYMVIRNNPPSIFSNNCWGGNLP